MQEPADPGKMRQHWKAVSVKPRVPSLLPYWQQDRVPSVSALFSSPFKQGVSLPRLVQHMPCKISVNGTLETHKRWIPSRYNPPDSVKSAGVVTDGPPVKVSTWRRRGPPAPVFLLGEPRGQRSLAGCSPWGHRSWTWLSAKLVYRNTWHMYFCICNTVWRPHEDEKDSNSFNSCAIALLLFYFFTFNACFFFLLLNFPLACSQLTILW